MTVSYFLALEGRIPAMQAERSMQLAQAAVYPHVTREGAERMWQAWTRATDPDPLPSAMPVKGALFTLNGRPVSFEALRIGLGQAIGGGLAA